MKQKKLKITNLIIDLEEDLKNFELWLQKAETLIEKLTLNSEWTINEIEIRLNEHKVSICI
jgi:hypothetical protein